MKIILPGTMKSLITDIALPVELNDTDVDRMMTRLLEMSVKLGQYASGVRVDPKNYEGYLRELQASEHVVGFDGDDGLRVLDGWVRSSVLHEERAGLARSAVQMGYLKPLTIAAYRSGLPVSASRNRRADALTYDSVRRVFAQHDNPAALVSDLFVKTFGAGVDLGVSPWASPAYDGHTDVDIDTLLALRFLEGFRGSENAKPAHRQFKPLPVPEAVDPLGRDLVAFLRHYGPVVPVAEAFTHLSALISLRLFQLPLITARVLRGLFEDQEIDLSRNPSEIYCDFVRSKGSPSDDVARQCVTRDLEIMRTFFRDRLLVRELHDTAEEVGTRPPSGADAPAILRWAVALKDDGPLQFGLGIRLRAIQNHQDRHSEEYSFIESILGTSELSPLDRLAMVLVEGSRQRGVENQTKWFYNTGGITKPYGILLGTVKSRPSWRYAPTDEALTTLLCMCFVDDDGVRVAPKLAIREVLDRLERRYGLLVDHPPSGLDSAAARAGAAQNLDAFTDRLKLLGCFEGLSDDFSAQFVTRPRQVTTQEVPE